MMFLVSLSRMISNSGEYVEKSLLNNSNLIFFNHVIFMREMQIKPSIRYRLIPVRMATLKSLQRNVGDSVEKGYPHTVSGHVWRTV